MLPSSVFSQKRFLISLIMVYSSDFFIIIYYENKKLFRKIKFIILLKRAFENIIFQLIQVIFKQY